MLDGKLRIAPTCYHMLHQVPVMTAHEIEFLLRRGAYNADGSLGYEILTDSMVPFGLEKLGISQAMKEKSVDIALDVQSRTVFYQRARGADLYVISGWRNQHTNVWIAPPHIKIPPGIEGQAGRYQRFQQHSPLGDPDSTQKGRSGFGEGHRVGAHRRQLVGCIVDAIRSGKVECAPVPPWYAKDCKKRVATRWCRRPTSIPTDGPSASSPPPDASLKSGPTW